jgi:predicted component of type VI protein secretion system
LSHLERCVSADGPAERAVALNRALTRLEREIEGLYDPSASGRGRVMFVPLSGAAPTRFSTQLQLRNRVVLDDRPFVHPLLESLEQGRAAGVILVSRDLAEVLEWRHGELVNMARVILDVDAPSEDPRAEAPRPAGHQQTAPSPEGRERRADDQRRRFVDRIATAAMQLATRRGWERAVISGDERLTGPLLRALPEPLRDNAVRDPRHLIESDSRSLNAIVSQLLEQQQAESDLRLTDRILNAARAAEGGALGLSEVLAALNEARVMHLIYDPDLRYAGAIADDGQLSSPPEQRPTARVVEEPRLTERMVERCLATGARVTPVGGRAAEMLADAGGVAAQLRW